jgi:large conductance mechanosensitive channel
VATIREDFVKFIQQANLVQLAVAFVIGIAFAALMTALVADIFTPLLGAALHIDFSAWSYTINGSTVLQGAFLNSLISFLLMLAVVFFLIALPWQRHLDKVAAAQAKLPPTTRPCPECLTQIPLAATRCSACGVVVTPQPAAPAPPAPAAKKKRF